MKAASPKTLPFFLRSDIQITSGMRKFFCLSLLIMLKASGILAQPTCGFDQNNKIFQQTFPAARKSQGENEKKLQNILSQKQLHQQTFSIPIVVHILHTGDTIGSPYNPTDERIFEAITYLNQIYSGTHASLTPAGRDAAGDIGIRFEFAQRDPECNPTNGIRRVNMSENTLYLDHGALNADIAYDTDLKSAVAWDVSRYYNIYVVNKINGNDGSFGPYIAGFAYFPVNHIVDGTVILASEMKSGSKTLIHEIGHAFNLYHPFEGSENRYECPSGSGDFVDDTDPITFNADRDGIIDFTCRSGTNDCTNNPYSIRTESNIMNYTACYTLFTPGQKERMKASLLLDARASLINSTALMATFNGDTQACDPKINFENDEATVPLPLVQKTGCREFKDLTFYFTISNSPTKNATVLLTPDGLSDAKEKVDFDFVGGKQVVFPAGSRQKKPFKIRVYDTGQREDPIKLILNFTVNSGDGTTLKGTATPTMRIWLKPNNTKPVVKQSKADAHIGSPNRDVDGIFDRKLSRQKSVIQYNREEMTRAGLVPGGIVSMQLFVTKFSKRPFKNLKISISHSASRMLVEEGNITSETGKRQVFSSPSYATIEGANTFVFSKPFVWNGRDNIRIETCFDNGSDDDSEENDLLLGYGGGPPFDEYYFLSSQEGCGDALTAFSYQGEGIRPVAVFSQIAAGNPVAVAKVVSQRKYLGPYGELFFYDNSNPKKIIASVKNLSDWNYGCTTVEIDREGTRAFPFWNINPQNLVTEKTFLVTPQYSNAGKKLEVKLYYTEDEKAGYEQMTGGNWQQIQLFKTNGTPVGSINPFNPQISNVEISPGVQQGDFGTDYTLSATFATGLAEKTGFATGLINSALPLSWVQFKGVDKSNFVALDWITENEVNTSYFDIEASRDGVNFSTLGQLTAGGSSTHSYNYNHDNPGTGTWFYRVKQVDKDQKYTYSEIIRIRLGSLQSPIIYPVPAANVVTVDFGKTINNATLKILTVDLKPVSIEKIAGLADRKQISIERLPAGNYLLQVLSASENYVLRFIKY